MSLSKKANRKASLKNAKRAQMAETSVRSSRVTTGKRDQSLASSGTHAEVRPKTKRSSFLTNILRVLALLVVVAITLYIYSIRERVEQFAALGYPGIFLIAMLANATILLPAPGVAVIYAMGAIFNPLGVGLAAGAGGTVGELSGYLAGFSGQAVVERMDVYRRVKPWIDKYGGWAIMVLSAIPNPFFDVAGIAAGIAKMHLRTFLIFTFIGQLIKMTVFAVLGHYSIALLSDYLK